MSLKKLIQNFVDVERRNHHIEVFRWMVTEVEGIEYVLEYIEKEQQNKESTADIDQLIQRTLQRIHEIQENIPDYKPFYNKQSSKENIEYYTLPAKQMNVENLEQARRWVENTLNAYDELELHIPRLYRPFAAEEDLVEVSVPIDNIFLLPIALTVSFLLIAVMVFFIKL